MLRLPRVTMLAPFNELGFRLFYANSIFASVDMNIRMAVHGWLILELSHDSEFWLGIYAFALGIGQFLFSSLAGTLSDQFQRKTILLVEGGTSFALSLFIAIGIFSKSSICGWRLRLLLP